MSTFPDIRLRRLRRTQALRDLTGNTFPGPEKFMWPLFIVEGSNKEIPIDSMPAQSRYSVDRLCAAIEPVAKSGVNSVLLFGVPESGKNDQASAAYEDDSLVNNAITEIKSHFPDLLIFTDVCVCAYTDHGHCGILKDDGCVDNDSSLDLLTKMAVSHAAAGADAVAPSAMMDGQILAIRHGLHENGFDDTILMSYSTKFASSMYGPFRDAAHSAPGMGDRKSYQAPYNDLEQALRESRMDVDEGADMLMVKPSMFYLDVITHIKAEHDLPLAAYNVSGEYSMLHASADRGFGDLYAMARESIVALDRAGTDIFISYWANQYQALI